MSNTTNSCDEVVGAVLLARTVAWYCGQNEGTISSLVINVVASELVMDADISVLLRNKPSAITQEALSVTEPSVNVTFEEGEQTVLNTITSSALMQTLISAAAINVKIFFISII